MIKRFYIWINGVAVVKRRSIAGWAGVLALLTASFLIKTSDLAARQLADVEIRQAQACVARVEVRETLRTLLSAVYTDVYHVLPESPRSIGFAEAGLLRIETLYPPLVQGVDC